MNSESAVQQLPVPQVGRLSVFANPNYDTVINCVDAATPPKFAAGAADALWFPYSRILPSFQKENA